MSLPPAEDSPLGGAFSSVIIPYFHTAEICRGRALTIPAHLPFFWLSRWPEKMGLAA